MSIFSRFADIINSNMNALLDKAEDPEKLIRMIIQEMEDTLVEVRTVSARSLAERKELARKASWLESELAEWQDKAELAVSKGRDDLAKAALVEKHKVAEEHERLTNEIKQVDQTLDTLSAEIKQLQEKLVDARNRQQSLSVRYQAQSSRLKVNKSIFKASDAHVVERFEAFERKLDELSAQSEVFGDSKASDLKAEIDELASSDQVASELEQLKQKVKS
ncbi:MAG: phage shock protein PspA [Kangiellaceae bacterium]|jgi:phage shock protein A|nr:phage shock protein PspA [Kangiellaceae bacterium]